MKVNEVISNSNGGRINEAATMRQMKKEDWCGSGFACLRVFSLLLFPYAQTSRNGRLRLFLFIYYYFI